MESAGINATLNADSLTPSASPLIFDAHPTRNPSPRSFFRWKKRQRGMHQLCFLCTQYFQSRPPTKTIVSIGTLMFHTFLNWAFFRFQRISTMWTQVPNWKTFEMLGIKIISFVFFFYGNWKLNYTLRLIWDIAKRIGKRNITTVTFNQMKREG